MEYKQCALVTKCNLTNIEFKFYKEIQISESSYKNNIKEQGGEICLITYQNIL